MADTIYSDEFFAMHNEASRTSAREAIPLVLGFVPAASVVDVGCGNATWLAEFKAAGIDDYLGIDGDYVNREKLLIESERFLPRDLAKPLEIGRRFDLAVSLEVAEHLPEESADAFVASLVGLAPVVLFSAAIPHQEGDGHINEQWPQYWHKKFAQRDYVVVDCLRPLLWTSPTISAWYAQNMLFFVEREHLGNYPRLASALALAGENPPLALVHPRHYLVTHKRMLRRVKDLRRTVARLSLSLQEINLIVFPDWSLPTTRIRAQLVRLFTALLAHPDCYRMTVIVDLTSDKQELPANLLAEAARQVLAPDGTQVSAGINVSSIGGVVDREEWEVLLSCLQWRVALPDERTGAVAAAEAQDFPSISLEAIERKEPLGADLLPRG